MASQFDSVIADIISDAPSGEITEIYEDLIKIVGESAKESILEAIEQYNIRNCIPIEVEGKQIIISEYNKDGVKFIDPITAISFSVDHLNRTGFDIGSSDISLSSVQEEIVKNLNEYTASDFSGEVTFGVYPIPNEEDKTSIIISSTKYNASNFWNGEWKSKYIFDSSSNSLEGEIDVDVHFYEDGNVSFKSNKKINLSSVNDAVSALKEVEVEFEKELDSSFSDLNEKQFKSLRRKLPITRSKVNWGKAIGNYRLGKDAAQGITN
ncbi:hypothetical protein TPHA_0C04010 [Tetrapisispora phaffii CBS 4417]|uniref:F-actin-capping protein subunit alpha n=1 Tax=Tetrapisispora phaffii (strain ATCC 24235 / CBS 4417 / NBRC 1672 / NRRL Y-8282 / UCD 70-5) TaxID=1071381 RepID=G8BQN9_TETPH|nr:hypothetical protein TPHA_0C04010 [Tetrapisispora phaffii CBS 4417]CCE62551.1 hypothetical protein TPHA_0C04010 [Tetrapisispora phaffii CBS 4417]